VDGFCASNTAGDASYNTMNITLIVVKIVAMNPTNPSSPDVAQQLAPRRSQAGPLSCGVEPSP
jgi:hypothetical protein